MLLLDQNVWLIERTRLLKHRSRATSRREDVDADTAPDDILIEMLLCNQVLLTRTDRPTVQYLHCGMSNRQNWRGVSGYE